MQSLNITLKTLTPLWTGGVDGRMDRIHETGIIGSLRWWYEAIVRGLGGDVCNPTSENPNDRCPRPDGTYCDVCRLFGATGWRRRFRLTFIDSTREDNQFPSKIGANRNYTDARGNPKTPTWYFNNKPQSGILRTRIQSLDSTFPSDIVAGLVQFASDWTAIGARPQMGFGVVQVENGRPNMKLLYDHLVAQVGSKTYENHPALNNMFLTRISVPTDRREETFNLKYDLRALFRGDRKLRHFIMGTVHGTSSIGTERMAAKIKMSHPYNGVLRLWGWVPSQVKTDEEMDRESVISAIYNHLQDKDTYTVEYWREMNTDRDTQTQQQADAKAFLRSLLQIKEEDVEL